jgi:hypothetical protein
VTRRGYLPVPRFYRILIISVCVFFCIAGAAQAIGVGNLPATHRQAALNVTACNPAISEAIHAVYPGVYVRFIYGGYAGLGFIDVSVSLWGKAFTHQVAEEWCHELQRACDEPGGYGPLTNAWHAFMSIFWPQVDTSRWTGYVWNHTLMEALRQAWWYPYYANGPDYRVYATRAQMIEILESVGVMP